LTDCHPYLELSVINVYLKFKVSMFIIYINTKSVAQNEKLGGLGL